MKINTGLKLPGFAYFFKHQTVFTQVAPDPLVVLKKELNVSAFVSSITKKHLWWQTGEG